MRTVDQTVTLKKTFSLDTSYGIIATPIGEFAKGCHLKGFLLLYADLNLWSVSITNNTYLIICFEKVYSCKKTH